MIYNLGLTIGLTVTDIDKMTAGEIIDLAYYKANHANKRQNTEEDKHDATQEDYDRF